MSGDISTPRNLPDFSGLDLAFDIVDSHHHLFDLQAVHYPWLTDHQEENFLLGNYDALKRNYSPTDLRRDMAKLRVVKTVHVEAEADRDGQLDETRWLTGVMAEHGLPNAIVAHAWLNRPNSAEVLAAQAAFPAVRGIRSKPRTSPTAASRGDVRGLSASLQDPAWRKAWAGCANMACPGICGCRSGIWRRRRRFVLCTPTWPLSPSIRDWPGTVAKKAWANGAAA